MLFGFVPRLALAVAAGAILAACAQHGTVLPLSAQSVALPDASPPDCKGQQNEERYATLTAPLKSQGGSFCIPAFGGFGGGMKYPGADPSVNLTLTSSTANYDHQPKLGKGKAIFYLQFAISGATQFGTSLKAGGGLTGSELVAGKPYTAVGQVTIFGEKVELGPCYATATAGKYGGVIGGLGTLVKGKEIPTSVSGVIEIYSGQQTGTQC